MRTFILSAALLAALTLAAGCSMEQGGTEDPQGFETVQGLDQPAETAPVAAPEPTAALERRIAALESENTRLASRLDELETRFSERSAALEELVRAIEEQAAAAPAPPADQDGKPLIDLGDDKAFEEQVVRQGLEQILNMSRLLLDKMEYEMGEKLGGSPEQGDTPGEAPAGEPDAQATESQAGQEQ